MSRHVFDRRTPTDGTRVPRLIALARQDGEEGSHPATRVLMQRPTARPDETRRLQEFLRIARGRTV